MPKQAGTEQVFEQLVTEIIIKSMHFNSGSSLSAFEVSGIQQTLAIPVLVSIVSEQVRKRNGQQAVVVGRH